MESQAPTDWKSGARQTKSSYELRASAGYRLVRAGGLGLYSCDSEAGRDSVHFQSLGIFASTKGLLLVLTTNH